MLLVNPVSRKTDFSPVEVWVIKSEMHIYPRDKQSKKREMDGKIQVSHHGREKLQRGNQSEADGTGLALA